MQFQTMLLAAVFATVGCIFAPSVQAQKSAAETKTVLNVNVVRGYLTIYVNGAKVGTYGKKSILDRNGKGITDNLDVSPYTQPGSNTLRVTWSGTASPVGQVRLSNASGGEKFRMITRLTFDVMSKPTGDKRVTFKLPNAKGTFAETPASTRRPRVGSHEAQTLLTANIVRGHITVFVNDKKVGSYDQGVVPIDISNYVHAGENTLRLSWDEGMFPVGEVSVSYAEEKNRFRKIASYKLSVFTKKTGGKPVAFMLPQSAGR